MDEEEVETLMLDIERWAEKSKMSGYAQSASQAASVHQTPGLLGGNEIKNTYTELFLELY